MKGVAFEWKLIASDGIANGQAQRPKPYLEKSSVLVIVMVIVVF